MLAYIIYDTGDGIIIYEANLTDEESLRMESLHGRYGGSVDVNEEDDKFLSDIENSISTIKKVFDETSEDDAARIPITTVGGAKVYLTGFLP